MIRRVAASPSITGMRMSIRTTSGRSSRTVRSASSPSAASPATSMSRLRVEQRPEAGPHQDLVVGEQYADHRSLLARAGRPRPVDGQQRRAPGSRRRGAGPPRSCHPARRPAPASRPGRCRRRPRRRRSRVRRRRRAAARVRRSWIEPHARVARARVPYDVGERLLDDAEGGEVGAGREPGRAPPSTSHRQARARRLLHQFGQPVEAGRGSARRVARRPQGVEHLAHLPQRLLAGGLDGGRARCGPARGRSSRSARPTPACTLITRDAVREDVVQLAGDPQPLLVGPPPLGLRAFGALPGPLLAASPDQLGAAPRSRSHPGGDRRSPAPGGAAVARRAAASGRASGRPARCPAQSIPAPPRTALRCPATTALKQATATVSEDRPVRVAERPGRASPPPAVPKTTAHRMPAAPAGAAPGRRAAARSRTRPGRPARPPAGVPRSGAGQREER